MKFGSVCSGIEAASAAWHPLGWEAQFFSEIEPFPCSVLAHHYPTVPNLGDMTKFKDWPDYDIDVLVGGTPCQSFSVAGLRKGLADPRGNLMLTYLAIADKYRPEWLVWENVPGVLSSNGGKDFGTFLGGLAELRYGFAYRVLDAQYVRVESHSRAVPQRRRRVFVVGYLGDWRRAAAVLFERESLCGHPAPRREAGQEVTGPIMARTTGGGGFGGEFECSVGLQAVAPTLNAAMGKGKNGQDAGALVAHSLRGEGFDASEDGTGRGTPLIPYAFQQRIARNGRGDMGDVVHALSAQAGETGKGDAAPCIATGSAVRRLTPRECERLQGFPDDYTLINVRGKPAADGPRYKALGNSMAVPVMAFIGQRIQLVSELQFPTEVAA